MKAFAEYYQNYPEITILTQSYDIYFYYPELVLKAKKVLYNRIDYISRKIEEAKKMGLIRSDVECSDLGEIIYGILREQCHKWRIESYKFDLKEKVINMVELIIKVFHT
jgi:hypothetical protein